MPVDEMLDKYSLERALDDLSRAADQLAADLRGAQRRLRDDDWNRRLLEGWKQEMDAAKHHVASFRKLWAQHRRTLAAFGWPKDASPQPVDSSVDGNEGEG